MTRREERRIAIDVLYQADITDASGAAVLAEWRSAGRDVPAFTEELVEGVWGRLPDIDLLLETHAEGWSVQRMAALGPNDLAGWCLRAVVERRHPVLGCDQ